MDESKTGQKPSEAVKEESGPVPPPRYASRGSIIVIAGLFYLSLLLMTGLIFLLIAFNK